ncbi:hypothetical protein M413DRAFT_445215 [Hebeloma cylindrosporum]|uniref:Zn(2)-C6 fungal-type domain-containing protein n=1 Tax=Hebeloma cylindrosporum TaxID=76867 RepID=A0A0C3CCR0_HEBCY|nr:hypothetical protein M413DRAFT_445215 [Hebeloma cylindrosporum h7]
MTLFSFTAGSLGDIISTIDLTTQVVRALYDHRNITRECDTLAMEVRSLQQVLILTNVALTKYESTPLGEPLVHCILPEIAQCHLLLRHFSHKIDSCRQALTSTTISTLWRRVIWAASGEAASLSAKLSGHRLKLSLLLMSLNSVEFLDSGQVRKCKEIDFFPMKRIQNDMIGVMDPQGDTIGIPTLFCSSWESFHYVMQSYFVDRVGKDYIERGDYGIIRQESNQAVDRSGFAKAVREGDGNVFEMSIILKTQTKATKECPRCSRTNTGSQSESGWTRCSHCSCRFNVDHTTTVSTLRPNFSLNMDRLLENGGDAAESKSNAIKPGKKQSDVSETKYFRRITLALPAQTNNSIPPPMERRLRACNFCRSMKLKCDGGKPSCGPCTKTGKPCNYFPPRPVKIHLDEDGEEDFLYPIRSASEAQIAQRNRSAPLVGSWISPKILAYTLK